MSRGILIKGRQTMPSKMLEYRTVKDLQLPQIDFFLKYHVNVSALFNFFSLFLISNIRRLEEISSNVKL